MLGRIQLVAYLGDGLIQILDDSEATESVLLDLDRLRRIVMQNWAGPSRQLQFRVSPEVGERFIEAWEAGLSVRVSAEPYAPKMFCGIPLETGILER